MGMSKNIGWPLKTNKIRRGMVNHTFGMVRRMANGKRRAHQGWDLYSLPGYRCYSISDGVVVSAKYTPSYGNQVLIKFKYDFDDDGDTDTLYVFYAHLSRIDVVVGQNVVKGEQIGLTGNTGNAESMRGLDQHLHIEIRTRRLVGRGLDGRISPLSVFKEYPISKIITEKGPFIYK